MSLVPGVCVALLTLSKDSLDGEPMREEMFAESVIYMATQKAPNSITPPVVLLADVSPPAYYPRAIIAASAPNYSHTRVAPLVQISCYADVHLLQA